MNPTVNRLLIAHVIAAAITGCATAERFAHDAQATSTKTVSELSSERDSPVLIRSEEGNHISAVPVEYTPPTRGRVTLKASDLPLAEAISGIAQAAGLSVTYQTAVDPAKPVSIDLREVDPEAAIRELAYAAGFVAVFDLAKAVTIARDATFTFRVPSRAL